MSLFAEQEQTARRRVEPLAVRMRPRALDGFVGQESFLGEGRLLRRMLAADRLTSLIFHGPPGCGKTTLAEVIAAQTSAAFERLHAAEASVRDVRAVVEKAVARLSATGQRTILFLDEIHRFSRSQQDVLLRDVESGLLTLIGATTENPYVSVNGPLLSRSTVFEFAPLSVAQIAALLRRALLDDEHGLGHHRVQCPDDVLHFLAERADGDARRALSALEIAVLSQLRDGGPCEVTLDVARDAVQQKALQYDAAGDTHYDVASALIKSMRGSEPDAALYWLARMLEGGEDPRFIARRIAICASEDVGNADPQALAVAAAAVQVVQFVGLPECQYALAQAVTYIACAPKSNAVTRAIHAARDDVRDKPVLAVPAHLRDRSYARDVPEVPYLYPHDFPGGYVEQDYLGAARRYYNPSTHGDEGRMAAAWRERIRRQARPDGDARSSSV